MSGNPRAALEDIANMAANKRLTVHISQTFPIEQIADAHTVSQSGHVRGKLIVTI
jgi:NADPH:quinone reductase-like Zn-dependent oxidoreductase